MSSLNNTLNDTINTNTTSTSTGPQALQGFDAYLYTAYALILLSYINVNILVFRTLLILAAMLFMIWGCQEVRAVQVDTLIFNSVYIIINIVQSIPLVKQILPVKLTDQETEIYERDFKAHMGVRQFKHFIQRFKSETVMPSNKNLIATGSPFRYLIYIAKINPGYKVFLASPTDYHVKDVTEGSWIGTIEYVIHEENMMNKERKSDEINWGISANLGEVEFVGNEVMPTVTEQKLIPKNENGVVIYKVDLNVRIFFA